MILKDRDDVVSAYMGIFSGLDSTVKKVIGELVKESMDWQERLDSLNNDEKPESKLGNERAAQAYANVTMCREISRRLMA